MTLEDRPETCSCGSKDPLGPYLEPFAAELNGLGYRPRVRALKLAAAADFNRWLHAQQITAARLTHEDVQRYLRGHPSRSVRSGAAVTLRRLVDFLIRLGVVQAPEARIVHTPIEIVVSAFAGYLLKERELSKRTLLQYCPFIETFLFDCFGSGRVDLTALRAQDVVRFVQCQAARLSRPRARAATIAVRAFLRYAQVVGETQLDLASAVPAVSNWSMTGIPRAIAPDHLCAVLDHCPRDTATGRRDYAILLLLARLGLRSCEIVSLTLDSIDWTAGTIAVVGKGNQPARLPLPAEVGEAIACYLRGGRQKCWDRALFLRVCAPIRGLGSQTTIGSIVGAAIARTGIKTPHRGAHQFRHALAADMLRHGASLTEIGGVLRHRRAKTTSIYAKVDFDTLRPLSLPWPRAAT